MRADKSLKPFEIRLYRHYRVVHGVRIALAFVLTFLLVRLLNVPEGTWPLITLRSGKSSVKSVLPVKRIKNTPQEKVPDTTSVSVRADCQN